MMISPNSNNAGLRRTAAMLCAMTAIALAAMWQATVGFRVVSTEAGRRLAIEEAPPLLPPAGAGLLAGDGRVAIMTFFYTSCQSICSVQGTELQQMQREILARGLQDKVRLVSVSFDERDSARDLAHYAERMRAAPEVWRFASVPDTRQRRALLDTVGIVVLPAPLGEFQHNAAFHIVRPDGRLVRVIDYEQPDLALHAALEVQP